MPLYLQPSLPSATLSHAPALSLPATPSLPQPTAAWTVSHPPRARLTSHGFAAVGVTTAGCVALHTQTLVTAVGVDAELAAGEGGAALVHVGAGPAVVFKPEARTAAALWVQGIWA